MGKGSDIWIVLANDGLGTDAHSRGVNNPTRHEIYVENILDCGIIDVRLAARASAGLYGPVRHTLSSPIDCLQAMGHSSR